MEYTFDEDAMDKIKIADSNSFKTMCSGVIDDQWFILIYPNGHIPDFKGISTAFFGFVKWPRNTKSITGNFRIYDANDTSSLQALQMIPYTFGKDGYYIGRRTVHSLKSVKKFVSKQ